MDKPLASGHQYPLPWLQAVGQNLTRIRLDDEEGTQRVRTLAARLEQTDGLQVDAISTLPYLNGQPAGLAEQEPLAWIDFTLYIAERSHARLARILPERVAGLFGWSEVQPLLAFAFGRSSEEIRAYVQENFELEREGPTASLDQSEAGASQTGEIPARVQGGALPSEEEPQQPPKPEVSPAEPAEDTEDEKPETHRARPPEPKPSLIKRFAIMRGFHEDSSSKFVRGDGTLILKADGPFPWLLQGPLNEGKCYLWLREHCLEEKPLEVPVEVWKLLEQDPKHHAMILQDPAGNPVEMIASELLAAMHSGILRLYPATYRLALNPDL